MDGGKVGKMNNEDITKRQCQKCGDKRLKTENKPYIRQHTFTLQGRADQSRPQSNKKKSRMATIPLFSCCFHVANPFKRFFLIV
jgi:hypothetical protein